MNKRSIVGALWMIVIELIDDCMDLEGAGEAQVCSTWQ